MPGTSLGKYRIVGQLGRGTTGIVYRAVDDTLGREVALKILNPSLTDPAILERFRAEAKVLASLNHPGIATIYDLVCSETELLMVMELVRGETLEHLSDRVGPMPPERAIHLVDRILSALEHAHRAGVVHRDLKPANVMVTESGGIKIMDFGVARARSADPVGSDGYVVGTPAYMPPEQVLGEDVDGRADLYSVGVVFYRLLAGAFPFTADSPMGMLQQQISALPSPLRAHRAHLPDWCDTIVRRALAKSPHDRFQSARAFREALVQASGMRATIDLAAELALTPNAPVVMRPAPSSADGDDSSVEAGAVARTLPFAPRARARADAILVSFAACIATLAYLPLQYPQPTATPQDSSVASALVFQTKLLAGDGRERDARLVLSDRKLTVTTESETRHPLHSVPYVRVVSISYTRSRDPLWSSPKQAVRKSGDDGALRQFVHRHWIALRTNMETRFVVLRFEDAQIRKVLSALEDRTGRAPTVLGKTSGG